MAERNIDRADVVRKETDNMWIVLVSDFATHLPFYFGRRYNKLSWLPV